MKYINCGTGLNIWNTGYAKELKPHVYQLVKSETEYDLTYEFKDTITTATINVIENIVFIKFDITPTIPNISPINSVVVAMIGYIVLLFTHIDLKDPVVCFYNNKSEKNDEFNLLAAQEITFPLGFGARETSIVNDKYSIVTTTKRNITHEWIQIIHDFLNIA